MVSNAPDLAPDHPGPVGIVPDRPESDYQQQEEAGKVESVVTSQRACWMLALGYMAECCKSQYELDRDRRILDNKARLAGLKICKEDWTLACTTARPKPVKPRNKLVAEPSTKVTRSMTTSQRDNPVNKLLASSTTGWDATLRSNLGDALFEAHVRTEEGLLLVTAEQWRDFGKEIGLEKGIPVGIVNAIIQALKVKMQPLGQWAPHKVAAVYLQFSEPQVYLMCRTATNPL